MQVTLNIATRFKEWDNVKKRIKKDRWKDWQIGIKENLKNPEFCEVWEEIKKESPSTFSFLTKLEDCEFNCDPAKDKTFKNA